MAARRAAGRLDEPGLGVDPVWTRVPGGLGLVVMRDPARAARVVAKMRWGQRRSSWPGDGTVLYCRAETVAGRGPFREAARRRRLFVPLDGYVQRASRGELAGRRFAVRRSDGAPMAVAGLWAEDPDGPAFCIVTSAANPALAVIHDRMPLVLEPDAWPAWLGGRLLAAWELAQLMRPCRPEALAIAPVPRRRRPPDPHGTAEQMRLLGLDAGAVTVPGSAVRRRRRSALILPPEEGCDAVQ